MADKEGFRKSYGWMYKKDVSDLKGLREILEDGEDFLFNLDRVKITEYWVNLKNLP